MVSVVRGESPMCLNMVVLFTIQKTLKWARGKGEVTI